MKVDKSLKSVGGLVVEGNASKSGKTDSNMPEAGVGAEPGGLSSRPQLLKVQVVSRDLVDAVRVSQIKQAISEGRFKVKTEVVADRLLQAVRKLIASFRR